MLAKLCSSPCKLDADDMDMPAAADAQNALQHSPLGLQDRCWADLACMLTPSTQHAAQDSCKLTEDTQDSRTWVAGMQCLLEVVETSVLTCRAFG